MIDFSFNEEENILHVKRIGEIHTQDILDVIDSVNNSFKNTKYLYILQDTTESSMKYNMNDLNLMIEKFQEKLNNYNIVKIANYTTDPLETATALIFEEHANRISKLHHKTFSTIEYAKHWLQKGMIRD